MTSGRPVPERTYRPQTGLGGWSRRTFVEDYDSDEERRRWRDMDRLAWAAGIALLIVLLAVKLVAEHAGDIAWWVAERWT